MAALRKENKALKKSAHQAAAEAADERNRYARLEKTAEQDRKELAELREWFFNQENEVEEHVDTSIAYPYSVRKRVIVLGGHESWIKAIKPLLQGNIRFFDRNTRPNIDAIRNADTIWIQSKSWSHKDFYKVIEIIRTADIDRHYFKFRGAEKCAEQIAKMDMNGDL